MNIELPKDAEGREIPLDTKVIYQKDGKERKVIAWEFNPRGNVSGWIACMELRDTREYRAPKFLYLTPPDSWKKLLEDLDRGASEPGYASCAYLSDGEGKHCTSRITTNCVGCDHVVMRDIASRIRKLRGEDA